MRNKYVKETETEFNKHDWDEAHENIDRKSNKFKEVTERKRQIKFVDIIRDAWWSEKIKQKIEIKKGVRKLRK